FSGAILDKPCGERKVAAGESLSEGDRRTVFDATLQARSIESLVDPDGLSTTARAVLGRILGALEKNPG
ncbi:MAG TPA: hypothetical protein VJ144_05105, partial [Candidatus Polarisedimenticolia bacterium]|nr:hypothetical protein [Candidatus Polarisedimenticolia bacterium]